MVYCHIRWTTTNILNKGNTFTLMRRIKHRYKHIDFSFIKTYNNSEATGSKLQYGNS